MKIAQALKDSNIFLKGITKTIKNETKEQKRIFRNANRYFRSFFVRNHVNKMFRAGYENKQVKGMLSAGYESKGSSI